MKVKIGSDIIPVGSVYTSRFKAFGYTTWMQVLEKTNNSKEIKALAKEVKIDKNALTAWANRARLVSVVGQRKGVLDLLSAAGVTTPKKLKLRNSDNLSLKLKKINEEQQLAKRAPSAKQLKTWIEKAKAI